MINAVTQNSFVIGAKSDYIGKLSNGTLLPLGMAAREPVIITSASEFQIWKIAPLLL